MAEGRYAKVRKPYELFVKNLGYEIFYNGNRDDDSTVFMVLYIKNPDDPNNFNLAFFENYGNLTLESFIKRVLTDKDNDNFAKDMVNRIKGCTVSKTDVVFCLLESGLYTIDQVYGGGNLHLNKKMLKLVSDWINFKGGRNALTREQIRAKMNS